MTFMSQDILSSRIVDADHPWLGLHPFTEESQQFFFGRDGDIADIFVRVRGNSLTTLYGQSGLGKTSLLGAGLIPKLRVERFRPVLIRLRYESGDLPLIDQVKNALVGLYPEHRKANEDLERVTLWEIVHHLKSRPPKLVFEPPVLILDQFEEIFTLGQSVKGSKRHSEVADIFTQIADLVENRPPASLHNLFQCNPNLMREYDLNSRPHHVVIALREDFLSCLEMWKDLVPSLMQNRMPLRLLNGSQALDAVVKPGNKSGRCLVDEETGARIVRFVANSGPEVDLKDIGAVPPLLSLVCSELNEIRIKAEKPKIWAEHLDGDAEYILSSFYRKCFAGLHSKARYLVEDKLVSPAGFRESISFDAAVNFLIGPDLSRYDAEASINSLIQSRLLASENRGGTQRLELAHDVLIRMAIRSRLQSEDLAELRSNERELEESRRVKQGAKGVASPAISKRTVRVLISGPGDVAEERERARLVVAHLQRLYADAFNLVAVMWEDFPISTGSFQEPIDSFLSALNQIDIAVFILWSRLGTSLNPSVGRSVNSSYKSSIQHQFDLMLAAREQSRENVPIILAYRRHDEDGFHDILVSLEHDSKARELCIIQRNLVVQFISEYFQSKDGLNLRAYHSYNKPNDFGNQLRVHLTTVLQELLGDIEQSVSWLEAPYRGVEIFDLHHAPIFFGRDEETLGVLECLRNQDRDGCAFVCIVGASSSGKSSLARAGVAYSIINRVFDDSVREWRVVFFRPSLTSLHLFSELSKALASQLPELTTIIPAFESFLSDADSSFEHLTNILRIAFERASEKRGGQVRLLLVLDQMEELWTGHSISQNQREKFLQVIDVLARSRNISVLATLRSDFYRQAQTSEAFLRMKGTYGLFDLTPPSISALQDIIVQPALCAGLSFEYDNRNGRSLDHRILEDAARDPSALPLLQYLLAELYEQRDGKLLTFAAYEAIGSVEGVLAHRAESALDELSDETKSVLGEVLSQLVSLNGVEGKNVVRRSAPLVDFTRSLAVRNLMETLINYRILTADEQDGIVVVTFSHEAILHCWPRLSTWVRNNHDLLDIRMQIEHYMSTWERSGRDASYLLSPGFPLEQALVLVKDHPAILSQNAFHFIETSLMTEKLRQRRRALLQGFQLVAVSIIIVLAFLAGYFVSSTHR